VNFLSKNPIQDSVMFEFSMELIKNGIFTFPAIFPTVPRGRATFRLALQARHTKEHLDHVIETFDKLLRKFGVGKTSPAGAAGQA
jgi:7-keto-8-aminopelargonate synthetase-like enzyme